MLTYIRHVFAPLIIRIQETDALEETLAFLEACDRSKLRPRLAKYADRLQFLVAKELLRRGVPIWKF